MKRNCSNKRCTVIKPCIDCLLTMAVVILFTILIPALMLTLALHRMF